jgi:hypothetical protein
MFLQVVTSDVHTASAHLQRWPRDRFLLAKAASAQFQSLWYFPALSLRHFWRQKTGLSLSSSLTFKIS